LACPERGQREYVEIIRFSGGYAPGYHNNILDENRSNWPLNPLMSEIETTSKELFLLLITILGVSILEAQVHYIHKEIM
jgi:hypothetical protein